MIHPCSSLRDSLDRTAVKLISTLAGPRLALLATYLASSKDSHLHGVLDYCGEVAGMLSRESLVLSLSVGLPH